jgi:hypothetical protein
MEESLVYSLHGKIKTLERLYFPSAHQLECTDMLANQLLERLLRQGSEVFVEQ